jgi:hypothetical protein
MTRREAMLAALKGVFDTVVAPATGCTIHRNRRAALNANEINLKDRGQDTRLDQTEFKIHTARPLIEGCVAAENDEALGPAVNAVYGAIIDALEADVSLGGTAVDIRETGFEIEIDDDPDAKRATAWFLLSVEIEYTSQRVDSSQA